MENKLKLWRLERNNYYDTYGQHIVYAETEEAARQMAYDEDHDASDCKSKDYWLDKSVSTCVEIILGDAPFIVHSQWDAG